MEIRIERFKNNPLIEPDLHPTWINVFNCGVVKDDNGFKMLFRSAQTEDQSMSNLGLAFSVEGTKWYVLNEPVLKCGFNNHCTRGIEDPRIVKWIDGWYYIFATASSPAGGRVGIWRTKNFLEFEWIGIPFNQEDKDASIFPEPIGNFAYLVHRKAPHIWISRTQDMSLRRGWRGSSQILIKTNQFYRHPEHKVLPSKIGIAGPPIKTPKGWLLITHIVHQWDKEKTRYSYLLNRLYSLGFIVLDLEDPTKILYVHPEPILLPEERHEIVGAVPNVVFSCATVDMGDFLYIYWGGADTVICGGKLLKKDLPMCY